MDIGYLNWTYPCKLIFVFFVLIYGALGITIGPNSTAVLAGDQLILNCSSDQAAPLFRWYRIDNGNRIHLVTCTSSQSNPPYYFERYTDSCNMVVNNVTESEALIYQCEEGNFVAAPEVIVVVVSENNTAIMLDDSGTVNGTFQGNVSQTADVTCSMKHPTSQENLTASIAWDYSDNLMSSGIRNYPVAGGYVSTNSLIAHNNGSYNFSCSGSIISPDFPITVGSELLSNYLVMGLIDFLNPAIGPLPCLKDCNVCVHGCLIECYDWEITVFVLSPLILACVIGIAACIAKHWTVPLIVVTVVCAAFVITISVLGGVNCECPLQCILVIIFSVVGGLAVIAGIISLIIDMKATRLRTKTKKS